MELEDGKQNERRSHIKNGYNGYLERLNKEHKRMEKELKRKPKVTFVYLINTYPSEGEFLPLDKNRR